MVVVVCLCWFLSKQFFTVPDACCIFVSVCERRRERVERRQDGNLHKEKGTAGLCLAMKTQTHILTLFRTRQAAVYRCLREGQAIAAVLEDAAEKVFSKLEKLGERDNGLSIHVAHGEDVPFDRRRFLALCTEKLDPALIIVGIKKSEGRVDLTVRTE